jgi:coenzyme F420-0:L-glutamate ligase/coenzyme F420-1:gamma-L-glutamate ligase
MNMGPIALSVFGIEDIPMVQEGDDLSEILLTAIHRLDLELMDGDILVIAQKIVSKAEGRIVQLSSVTPSTEAIALAQETEKDPRLVQLILNESTEVLRKKPGVLIIRHKLGLVGAHAGIDQSNIEHGKAEAALLLPEDPDATAARLHREISDRCHNHIGILISDSTNRPWRLGTVGVAIGAAGLCVLDDHRGGTDLYGRELKVTLINRADSIVNAAMLVMGETTERIPAAIVRGFSSKPSDDNAAMIYRPVEDDLFR